MAGSILEKLKWGFLVVLAAAILAFYGLISLQEFSIQSLYLHYAPKVSAALLIVLAGKAVIELTSPLLNRLVRRHETKRSAHRVWAWAVWCVVAFIVVSLFVGDTSSMLITFGLLTLAASFAFRQPLLSLVGWMNITGRKLYVRGDLLEVGSLKGEVSDISLLSTSVWEFKPSERGITGRTVSIPNAFIFEHPISILHQEGRHVWDELTVNVPLGTDHRKAREVLLKACDEVVGVKKMVGNINDQKRLLNNLGISSRLPPEPEVFVFLNGDSVELRMRYLVDASQCSEVRSAISEHALPPLAKLTSGKK